jgi:hypothetical protein
LGWWNCRRTETLPDGTLVGIVRISGWEEVKQLPKVIRFDDRTLVRTGWNSHTLVAYYRSDRMVATPPSSGDLTVSNSRATLAPAKRRDAMRKVTVNGTQYEISGGIVTVAGSGELVGDNVAAKAKAAFGRRLRRRALASAYRSLGMTRVRGMMGGTYWE